MNRQFLGQDFHLLDDDAFHGARNRIRVFFHAGYANYDHCLDGRLRLLPDDDQLPGLQTDYDAMRAAAIVGDDAPSFDALIEEIRILEANANCPRRIARSSPTLPNIHPG